MLFRSVDDANRNINNNADFITGDWNDEHSLFAADSRLFGFAFDLDRFNFRDANALNVVLEDDPIVARERLSFCRSQNGDAKCPIACIGHPNIVGAKKNAFMIIQKVRDL